MCVVLTPLIYIALQLIVFLCISFYPFIVYFELLLIQVFAMRIHSMINSKNEATLFFYVQIDQITQSNEIVDSNKNYLNYMIL